MSVRCRDKGMTTIFAQVFTHLLILTCCKMNTKNFLLYLYSYRVCCTKFYLCICESVDKATGYLPSLAWC